MLACEADALPKALITWYKGQHEVLSKEDGTVKIYEDGVLEIQNMKFSDFGDYNCKAEYSERGRLRPQIAQSFISRIRQDGDPSEYTTH